jgi:hypothetical protein
VILIFRYRFTDSFFVCAEEQTYTQTNLPPVSSAGSAAPPGEPDLARIFII